MSVEIENQKAVPKYGDLFRNTYCNSTRLHSNEK